MILDSDVAREWSRTTVGLKIAGLWRNGIAFFVIGDLLSVEHDDCPGSVQGDFDFVPFLRFPLWVCRGFGQGLQYSWGVIFAPHVEGARANMYIVASIFG